MVFINPFKGAAELNAFEPVCWSIPVEFLGSLLVFACCLGLARSSRMCRTALLIGMLLYWMHIGKATQLLFTGGMLSADPLER